MDPKGLPPKVYGQIYPVDLPLSEIWRRNPGKAVMLVTVYSIIGVIFVMYLCGWGQTV